MEQNKVLIVLLTVLVVLGGALAIGAFFLSPLTTSELASQGRELVPFPQDETQEDRRAEVALGEEDVDQSIDQNVDQFISQLQEGRETFQPLEQRPEQRESETQEEAPEGTIDLPVEESPYVPASARPPRKEPSPKPAEPAAVASTQQRTQPPTTRSTARASSPAPAPRSTQEYWIQVGAYSDKYQAEFIAERMDQFGLKASVFTTQAGGRTLFRVRIGPYENRPEAEKFLAWITPTRDFENSYVSRVTVTR